VQRNIRSNLISQLPFLTAPAFREGAPAPVEAAPAPAAEEVPEEEETKGGKKKGGKGKGGGKSKDKGKKGAEEDEAHEDGQETVLDEIWSKKYALGLTKWCVYRGVKALVIG
jgi:PUA domain protein